MSLHQQVTEFNETYDVPAVDMTVELAYEPYRLLHRLVSEELQEVSQAYVMQDKVNYVKEIGDVIYAAAQQLARLGVNVDEVLTAIHASNMSKTGENGEVLKDEQGKVLKGPNYFKAEPAIEEMLHG